MLDPEVRRELRSLTRETADLVARHLVVTGRTLDDDPVEALAHARAARAMAGRIGVVREASGLAAYAAGEWNEALSELRAARRITGRPEHLAVMADCERALGRPERALAYADDAAVPGLAQEERVELVIVLAGARRDLGQADAAVLTLQDPARRTTGSRPWAARLWYAYADALLGAGRTQDARTQFEKVVEVDADGQTDAGDRLLELDGIVVEDLMDDEDDGAGLPDEELAAYVAEAFPRARTGAEAGAAGDSTDAAVPTTGAPAAAGAADVGTVHGESEPGAPTDEVSPAVAASDEGVAARDRPAGDGRAGDGPAGKAAAGGAPAHVAPVAFVPAEVVPAGLAPEHGSTPDDPADAPAPTSDLSQGRAGRAATPPSLMPLFAAPGEEGEEGEEGLTTH